MTVVTNAGCLAKMQPTNYRRLKVDSIKVPSVLNPIGKVGIPIPGTEVKVMEDGELCIKGNHVAQGYFKSEELKLGIFLLEQNIFFSQEYIPS